MQTSFCSLELIHSHIVHSFIDVSFQMNWWQFAFFPFRTQNVYILKCYTLFLISLWLTGSSHTPSNAALTPELYSSPSIGR